MATIHTLIDYDRQNPTAISREQYTDVGADAFSPGTFPRAFNDLEVWDAVTAGNQLVIDVDYELVDVDLELSSANYENEAVYKTLRIINATYQVGSIWLTYSAIGTYPTALLHDPSGLPAAGALDGTEPIATVQSGEMVKATPAEIATYAAGSAPMTDGFQALSAGIANTVQITGEYQLTEDNELDYSASFTDGMVAATVIFTELPTDTVLIHVQLELTDDEGSPLMQLQRSSGGTNIMNFNGEFADAGATNRIRGTYWIPTEGNTIYPTVVRASGTRVFKIIGYKTGE